MTDCDLCNLWERPDKENSCEGCLRKKEVIKKGVLYYYENKNYLITKK